MKKKIVRIAVVFVIAAPIIFILANAIGIGFNNPEVEEEPVRPKKIISFKGDFEIPPYSPGDSVEITIRYKNDKVSYKFRAFADSVYSREAVSNYEETVRDYRRRGKHFFKLDFIDEDKFRLGSKTIYANDIRRSIDTLGNVLEFHAEGKLDMSYSTFQQLDTAYVSCWIYND